MVEAFFEEIRGALERGESRKAPGFATSSCGQAAAPWAQPEDRRGDPDQRASRRDLPRQPETEGHVEEGAPWSKAAGKLNFRDPRQALLPIGEVTSCAG